MKTLFYLALLSVSTLLVIGFWPRPPAAQSPALTTPSGLKALNTHLPTSVASPALSTPSASLLPATAQSPNQPPPSPLPATTQALNELADSAEPLDRKMEALTTVMTSGSSDMARAAAVRSLYLVRNSDFTARLQPLILAGKIKPEAMEVLSLNLYDRPLDQFLPTLAMILDRPAHPLREMAADGLAFHLKNKAAATGPALALAVQQYLTTPTP